MFPAIGIFTILCLLNLFFSLMYLLWPHLFIRSLPAPLPPPSPPLPPPSVAISLDPYIASDHCTMSFVSIHFQFLFLIFSRSYVSEWVLIFVGPQFLISVCECARAFASFALPTNIFNGNRIRNLLKSATFATSLYFWTEIRFCPVYNFISGKFHQRGRGRETDRISLRLSFLFCRFVCVHLFISDIRFMFQSYARFMHTIIVGCAALFERAYISIVYAYSLSLLNAFPS